MCTGDWLECSYLSKLVQEGGLVQVPQAVHHRDRHPCLHKLRKHGAQGRDADATPDEQDASWGGPVWQAGLHTAFMSWLVTCSQHAWGGMQVP